MASWLRETSAPRLAPGEISEMYIGESIEAVPTAIPPKNLNETKTQSFAARAEPIAETKKMRAAALSVFLLPKMSPGFPESITPMIQPMSRLLTVHPSPTSLK